jgi:hypothetical protein
MVSFEADGIDVAMAQSNEDSFSSADLQGTLTDSRTLRKNLESTFETVKAVTEQRHTSIAPPEVVREVSHISSSESSSLAVYLRVRPLADKDEASTVEVLPDGKIRTQPPLTSLAARSHRMDVLEVKEYEFTTIFGPESSQRTVYDQTVAPLVAGVCSTKTPSSALIFSYGITNAGKTHTVLGNINSDVQADWGLVSSH